MVLAVRRNGAGERPRLRIRAGDLVPERRVVLEIEDDEGNVRPVDGYAWGTRCPGMVEARTLQHWNKDRDQDPESPTFMKIVGEPAFVAGRVREALEEAVLDLCDTLSPVEVSVMNSDVLGRILEDLGFLLPREGAVIDVEGGAGEEGADPPDSASDAPASSEAESTTPTPTTSVTC